VSSFDEDEGAETVILKREEFSDDGPTMFRDASLVDLLKQDLQEITENKEVYISVVGYEKTGLAVRYHLPENGKELDNIGRKVMREYKDQFSRNLYIGIDTMIHLCMGLYIKPPGISEEYIELDPEMEGSPVGFDYRLAGILGMDQDGSTARLVVKKVFGNNDLAIIGHAEKLNRWLMNTKADLSLELWQVGEAQE
jgi:hypothetical protein